MAEDLLKKAHLKITKQRQSIIAILDSNTEPMTAEEIFSSLQKDKLGINLSTVYRTLNVLCEKSVLLKILKADGTASYQLNNDCHNHYITCSICHRSVLIDNCPIKDLSRNIGNKTGFKVTGHSLHLIGICPSCSDKSKN